MSVTLPYILGIAGRGLEEAVTERPELLSGLNTVQGSVCHPGWQRRSVFYPGIQWPACAELARYPHETRTKSRRYRPY